jgi:hypothetical protein
MEALFYFMPLVVMAICMAGAATANKPMVAMGFLAALIGWAVFWPASLAWFVYSAQWGG